AANQVLRFGNFGKIGSLELGWVRGLVLKAVVVLLNNKGRGEEPLKCPFVQRQLGVFVRSFLRQSTPQPRGRTSNGLYCNATGFRRVCTARIKRKVLAIGGEKRRQQARGVLPSGFISGRIVSSRNQQMGKEREKEAKKNVSKGFLPLARRAKVWRKSCIMSCS